MSTWFGRLFPATLLALAITGARTEANPALVDVESTYELRLERIMNDHGHKAVLQRLEADLKKEPRPFVKAWLANYLIYADRFGIPELADNARGWALAKESQAEGSLFGSELVGRGYGDGRGPGFKNTTMAAKFVRQAADAGRATAMSELAKFYFFGIGVPRDRAEAERWALQAAWRGSTAGVSNLASWWGDPKYNPEPDPAKALWFQLEALMYGPYGDRAHLEALKEKGDALAEKLLQLEFLLGAHEGTNPPPNRVKKAVRWLDEHSGPDEARVQIAIAQTMLALQGPVYDPKRAIAKLTHLADREPDARAVLATAAWLGIGGPKDPQRAVDTWRELADQGNARSLHMLGWLSWWENGKPYGVPKDAGRAFDYTRRAADGGYWPSQYNLMECYLEGIGTPKNYHLAAKFGAFLSRRGHLGARRMRDRILPFTKD